MHTVGASGSLDDLKAQADPHLLVTLHCLLQCP